ncbi:DNA polymerase [Legionella norrlandica]|uniref:DNA polymerase n=1 Tax=Legionella norrlandica TaxID=1498499 RepID=A0A0A2T3Z9_9GAMM|nr:group II intron reverse transcriptase/maturase [Legionella norrlandica]KGP62148.1 DNA polymerase [Legionella norrlandica]
MDKPKPFDIPKSLVWEAYKQVKANKGGSGVDHESLEDFDRKRNKNLYKIWNRLSSGSYFPPAVRGVEIPKKQGGIRLLGVPTVSDRIAQMAIKLIFEPSVEPHFLEDSYGYRPNKSALDAIGVTRKRCWKYDWLIEFDIKGLFDSIDHELLMKAVRHHTENKCILLYLERWIKAPLELPDGTIKNRDKGTPQGGVISPLLSNLYLHYVFDHWMKRTHPESLWCRYADDGICHCKTKEQAEALLAELEKRFLECKLEIHLEKTKIVYCGKRSSKETYKGNTSFVFLGYEFRSRRAREHRTGEIFSGFLPAISPKARKAITQKIRELNVRNKSNLSLQQIADWLNPMIRGWLGYYGKFTKSELNGVFERLNGTLVRWSMKKYKKLAKRPTYAAERMEKLARSHTKLFAHWEAGITSVFI